MVSADSDVSNGPRGSSQAWMLALPIVAVVGVLAVFAYIAFQTISFGSTAVPGASVVAGKMTGDDVQALVGGLFGTIQFSLSVLSGVIIVFAAIISFVVGRSARQTQEASRIELSELARLYRENLDAVSSSIPTSAKFAVDKYIGEVDLREELDRYKVLLTELRADYDAVKPVVETYKEFRKASAELETDYAGPFLEFSAAEKEDGEVVNSNSIETRTKLQRVLIGLIEGGLRRRISANLAFNGAQWAARYQFHDLAHRLAVVADWLDSSDMHEMRVLRSEFERGDRYVVRKANVHDSFEIISDNPTNDADKAEEIRSAALRQMYDRLDTIKLYDSEFIYNEVWNVCVVGNEFVAFIARLRNVLDRANREGRYMSSYFHVILAQALAFSGEPGWRDLVMHELRIAIAKHLNESPASSWYMNSARSIGQVCAQAEIDPSELVDLEEPPEITH